MKNKIQILKDKKFKIIRSVQESVVYDYEALKKTRAFLESELAKVNEKIKTYEDATNSKN